MTHLRRQLSSIAFAVLTLFSAGEVSATEDSAVAVTQQIAPETLQGSDPVSAFIHIAALAQPIAQQFESKEDSSKPSPRQPRDSEDTRIERLVKRISERWDVSKETVRRLVQYAHEHSYSDFPKPMNLLAIMAVESSFNPKARNGKNIGVMQINLSANGKKLKDRSVNENVRVGADLLNEYYDALRGNRRAAVLSYNAGIGSYMDGRYRAQYWIKYQKELEWLNSKH